MSPTFKILFAGSCTNYTKSEWVVFMSHGLSIQNLPTGIHLSQIIKYLGHGYVLIKLPFLYNLYQNFKPGVWEMYSYTWSLPISISTCMQELSPWATSRTNSPFIFHLWGHFLDMIGKRSFLYTWMLLRVISTCLPEIRSSEYQGQSELLLSSVKTIGPI